MTKRRVMTTTLFAAMATASLLAAATVPAATPAAAAPVYDVEHVEEEVRPVGSGADALTYDPSLVSVGARVDVLTMATPAGTITTLGVSGLRPSREYGAHVHTNPCGQTGDAAGPHFQNVQDPDPSTADPKYANPDNEIWLDFTTDERGSAVGHSWVDWRIGDRPAGSVLIHERHTSTEPGSAGDAGDRLACVNVPFGATGQGD